MAEKNLANQLQPDTKTETPAAESTNTETDDDFLGGKRHSSHSHLTPSTALQNLPTHRIDPNRWYGLFRGYIRQDWNTVNVPDGVDELRANWVELFFDLIYVACIVHLSSEVAYSIPEVSEDSHRRLASDSCSDQWDYAYIPTAFAQFLLLWNGWRYCVEYTTHFVMNQQLDHFLRLLFMICILIMGIFIKDDSSYHSYFLGAYESMQLVHIARYAKVFLIPRGRNKAIFEIVTSLVIMVTINIVLATVRDACAMEYFAIYSAIWVYEYFVMQLGWVIGKCLDIEPSTAIPINVPHLSERYGLFIMLILGESIISVVSADLGDLDLGDGALHP